MSEIKQKDVEKEQELEYLRLNFRYKMKVLANEKKLLLAAIIKKIDRKRIDDIKNELAR